MYRFALEMTPEDTEAVATLLYVEMLEQGYTRVGEFHYLHHDRNGEPYANPAEMAARIARAAEITGIGLTLLPSFYAHSSFGGAAPHPGQRRFICSIDQFAKLTDATRTAIRVLPGANVGIAPHSLRAVTPDELVAIAPLAEGGPVHIHAAEQTREVEECIAWSGRRPVEWLLEHAPVDQRWCLIHATHLTQIEMRSAIDTGTAVGLCPVTEANLGDGIPALGTVGPNALALGTDSNARISMLEEMRWLEYGQRLREQRRGVLLSGGRSPGPALLRVATEGGARALGIAGGRLAPGCPADLVALDLTLPELEDSPPEELLEALIVGADRSAVSAVCVGGRWLVGELAT
jgi:formiminoglutamate deiminase